MINQLTPADKLNNIVTALSTIQTASKIHKVIDLKERNAAMIQNSIELAKIAATLRVQGSTDELFTGIFDAAALKFATLSAAYCSDKGLMAIDDTANFIDWLTANDLARIEQDAKQDAINAAYNERHNREKSPLPPYTKEQRAAVGI